MIVLDVLKVFAFLSLLGAGKVMKAIERGKIVDKYALLLRSPGRL
jgi:hypothetical protein